MAIAFALGSSSLLASFGCAPRGTSSKSSLYTTCVLPADQSGSISGRWTVAPIPIAFHQGDFSSSELSALMSAADTWNSFSRQSLGFNVLDYGTRAAPTISTKAKPTSICDPANAIISGNRYNGQVILYKATTWPTDYATEVIALTSFCPVPATPYPTIYTAISEVNYQYFFVSGARQPDLQSIYTHEFGHLIGLAHSCQTTAGSGIPSCTGASNDYITAIMFPSFGFPDGINGERKRSLQKNDQQRANCIYADFTRGS